MCGSHGLAYIADAPEVRTYWGYKDKKYYLVRKDHIEEVDKNGKKVGK